MSHFSVVVCCDKVSGLEDVLAPYSENLSVEPYRDYIKDSPADWWSVTGLIEKGLLPADPKNLTWPQVVAAHNLKYQGDESEMIIFDENARPYFMSTYNTNSKWDYWRIGGRWSGYFSYDPKYKKDTLVSSREFWDGPHSIPDGRCDGGPRYALDFEASRAYRAEEALQRYDLFHNIVRETPEALPWSEFLAQAKEGKDSIDKAREAYRAQPRVQALNSSTSDEFRYSFGDVISKYQKSRRMFTELARAQALPGYALLTLDRRWMSPGEMGWFGVSTDNESARIGYWEAANAYLETVPDDAYLVVVDCHI